MPTKKGKPRRGMRTSSGKTYPLPWLVLGITDQTQKSTCPYCIACDQSGPRNYPREGTKDIKEGSQTRDRTRLGADLLSHLETVPLVACPVNPAWAVAGLLFQFFAKMRQEPRKKTWPNNLKTSSMGSRYTSSWRERIWLLVLCLQTAPWTNPKNLEMNQTSWSHNWTQSMALTGSLGENNILFFF